MWGGWRRTARGAFSGACRQKKTEHPEVLGLCRCGGPGRATAKPAYCSRDSASCDMLLDCLSMLVLACISICLVVMLADSDA